MAFLKDAAKVQYLRKMTLFFSYSRLPKIFIFRVHHVQHEKFCTPHLYYVFVNGCVRPNAGNRS